MEGEQPVRRFALQLPWHIWGEVLFFSLLLASVFHVLLDRNRRG